MRRKKNHRASKLKNHQFTRRGAKQIYRKGPQGRKSFPNGILTSENNYDQDPELRSCVPECKVNEMCKCNYWGVCKCVKLYDTGQGQFHSEEQFIGTTEDSSMLMVSGVECSCPDGSGWSADTDGDIGPTGRNSFMTLFQACIQENCNTTYIG